jgi:hypothetical protein
VIGWALTLPRNHARNTGKECEHVTRADNAPMNTASAELLVNYGPVVIEYSVYIGYSNKLSGVPVGYAEMIRQLSC